MANHENGIGNPPISKPQLGFDLLVTNDQAVLDAEGQWESLEAQMLDNYAHVIVLRGAGSKNGMNKEDADRILADELVPHINSFKDDGGVVVMFDGDQDNPENPDIGYIMGRLCDECGEDYTEKALFVTAQKRSWYYPDNEGGNLGNNNGVKYLTYLFEDDTYEGDHNNFTQSDRLVGSGKFESWFVGSFGDIAKEQMSDMDAKAAESSVTAKIRLFPARVKDAEAKKPYGEYYDVEGKPLVTIADCPNLDFEISVARNQSNQVKASVDEEISEE